MTRDEAIKICEPLWGQGEASGLVVDNFVDLGILKLDEPVSLVAKLERELGKAGFGVRDRMAIHGALRTAHLKVVAG